MSPIIMSLIAIVVLSIIHWFYRWWNPKCNGNLPPGSMGWPLLGETLQFFTPSTTFDVSPFVKKRMERYGPIFRTSLVGRSIIVSADSELNYYVFQQEGQVFQSWYPDTFTEIFGRQNVGSLHGFMYKYLKSMVLRLFGPESLKKMLPEVEGAVLKQLHQWSSLDMVELKDATASMIFNLTAKKLISHDAETSSVNLRENFVAFIRGLISFPMDIPGTAYHECLQGRKRAMMMLKNMLQERRMMPRKENRDFFDYVLEELSKQGTMLTEEIALDLMFVLLFASFETTSLALTLAMKYLTDYPLVLQTLTEEHDAILKRRQNMNSGLTWKEYNTTGEYSSRNIQKSTQRRYTIPAGWGVMVCPPAVHLNPAKYENPLHFNPWRWEGGEINGASKHFMAFGGGMRFCVGADFTKVQMAVFLHCLVTKHRWQAIKGGNIIRTPGLQFPDGFYVRWWNPKCKGDLPPGSMGWPLLGETLQFFTPSTTFDVSPSVKKRMERYGPIFRTSLVGRPIIVSADPELNYYIFQQEGQIFQSWYPDSFTEIFG
ncbi:hypothetical protein Cgig2_002436 [Carnegiea gigantea]|uniref:Cytochrome P450 n=1 Tax=Carnegiea gigantea TaxID=171969 RepID=A0A9Q1KUT3_9CARY|nr:hypothetical protein Cgig2_002436 [Carnegiea gigantea]